jgi:hypothetical protein
MKFSIPGFLDFVHHVVFQAEGNILKTNLVPPSGEKLESTFSVELVIVG